MKHIKSCSLFILSFFPLILLLTGCNNNSQDALTDEEKEKILLNVENKTTELFLSINKSDYEMFSRDLDEKMSEEFSEDYFNELCTALLSQFGEYQSHSLQSIEKIDHYVSIRYNVQFEQKNDLPIIIIYQPEEPYNISGLWIDSPDI